MKVLLSALDGMLTGVVDLPDTCLHEFIGYLSSDTVTFEHIGDVPNPIAKKIVIFKNTGRSQVINDKIHYIYELMDIQ